MSVKEDFPIRVKEDFAIDGRGGGRLTITSSSGDSVEVLFSHAPDASYTKEAHDELYKLLGWHPELGSDLDQFERDPSTPLTAATKARALAGDELVVRRLGPGKVAALRDAVEAARSRPVALRVG